MWRDLLASRELAWQLLVRDISAQYRQSFLGIFWAFVQPIAAAVGLTLAKNVNAINIGETDLSYPAYVMLSMTLWQTFTEAVNASISGFDEAQCLMARVKIPREATVLARMGELIFNKVARKFYQETRPPYLTSTKKMPFWESQMCL
ncbi:MAG: hypothetical protein AAFV72_07665 [Cyanobacteria bacterium J06635_1]